MCSEFQCTTSRGSPVARVGTTYPSADKALLRSLILSGYLPVFRTRKVGSSGDIVGSSADDRNTVPAKGRASANKAGAVRVGRRYFLQVAVVTSFARPSRHRQPLAIPHRKDGVLSVRGGTSGDEETKTR